MAVLRTAKPQLTLTVQAEYVRPFLVSFQHPPLLISHRPDPEAKKTHAIIQKALVTYNKRNCQKMNLVVYLHNEYSHHQQILLLSQLDTHKLFHGKYPIYKPNKYYMYYMYKLNRINI